MIFIIISFCCFLALFVIDQVEIWSLKKELKSLEEIWQKNVPIIEEFLDSHADFLEQLQTKLLPAVKAQEKEIEHWKQEYYKLAYQYLTSTYPKRGRADA